MKKESFAIIEIGSNNTKTHVYRDGKVIYENTATIEFKKNYAVNQSLNTTDLEKLYEVIEKAIVYTPNVYIFGCSIFRNITDQQLQEVNHILMDKYQLRITVVSQKEEALFTACGCYQDIDYDGNMCVFIGGGGSIELIFVKNKEVVDQKYYDFGVVDITNTFPSLREDFNTCTFDEVYSYVEKLLGNLNTKSDILVLAGGDHLYWYDNAHYELEENTLYTSEYQPYMLTISKSDEYDKNALDRSLNEIRENSDNPLWFDGSRAMKVITNVISHKIDAKYIIPTKLNMENGLIQKINAGEFESKKSI